MAAYVERDLEGAISKYIDKKEIIAVVGVRQCGKSTLVNKILDGLEGKGRRVSRVTFDNLKVLHLFENDIDSFIELYVKGYDILFIDEVHYSKDSGRKLKYLYDNFEVKIFISGSSAVGVSVHSVKYLVGRIITFELYPFSFREFLRARNPKLLPLYDKGSYGNDILLDLNKYLLEFMLYGGYPRVVLAEDYLEKRTILENIYNTYLLTEIREILHLSEDYHLVNLLKALSLQIGGLIEYNSLSEVSGFSYQDLKKYLNILEKTFILKQILPYYTNKRTELVKTPKVYFIDFGFRNVCIDNFTSQRADFGVMCENFIFSELIKNNVTVKYWRTKSQAEVDFIIELNGEVIPVEVKTTLKAERVTRAVHSFIEKHKPKRCYVLSLEFEGREKNVIFLPLVKFNHEIFT